MLGAILEGKSVIPVRGYMKGQWIGTYSGSTEGKIIVNVDERPSRYQGVAFLWPTDSRLPSTAAFFDTQDKERSFSIRSLISAIDVLNLNALFVPWENVKSRYPEVAAFPTSATVTGSWTDQSLSLSWATDIQTEGSCVLACSKADKPSELPATDYDWESYKAYVANINREERYLFRGQNRPWRLRTPFHRRGRADLTRFLREDIQVLVKHLSARTKHVFNLLIPDENGAFFNLVQHHGYPTPMLDWTYSPYVAAFFAYRGISNAKAAAAAPTDRVRIVVFNQDQWKKRIQQQLSASLPWEHFSVGEFLAIENERLVPQQAASTVTSVDDIESYVQSKESNGTKYLWAFDLPVGERKRVIGELAFMGITAGALFPGLDGACEELAERNFED